MLQQRIYVGGICPEKGLSVDEVFCRLCRQLKTEMLLDVHKGTTYFQFSASNEEQHLDRVKSLLHNVTWKGCKLQVEEARLHFLDRLVAERQTDSTESLKVPQPTQKLQAPTKRRLWKIHRGFEKPSVTVDTQPLQCNSWIQLSAARVRHRAKQLNSKNPYYNRSIHLRLDNLDENDMDMPTQSEESPPMSDGNSVESSSLGSASSTDNKPTVRAGLSSEYVWSDDDSSSNETTRPQKQQRFSRDNPDTDEFTSGFTDFNDATKAPQNTVDVSVEVGSEIGGGGERIDIQEDVDRNLSVLAQIFPEVYQQGHDRHSGLPMKVKEKRASFSEVARFDPSNPASAERFLLQDTTAASPGDNDGDVNDTTNISEQQNEEADTLPRAGSEDTYGEKGNGIYEQEKLERVFQTARRPPQSDESLPPSGFSFGFAMDDSDAPGARESSSFTFRFNPKETAQQIRSQQQASGRDYEATKSESTDLIPSQDGRSILNLPTEQDLAPFVERFYRANGGDRILSDIDAWRNDPQVKETWMKRRAVLTDDWKRKRKFALAKKKKGKR